MKMQYSSLNDAFPDEVSSPDPVMHALGLAKAKAAKSQDEVKDAISEMAKAKENLDAKQRKAKAADDELARLEKEALRYDIWQQERLKFSSFHHGCRGTRLL